MKKSEIDRKFDEFWQESPPEISSAEKEKSWKKFYRKRFYKSSLKSTKLIKYAAVILIFAILGTGFYIANQPEKEIASLIHIENPGNQLKLIFLPDSSEIRLRPGSKISYSKNYIQKREISLQGNAFFKVTKDKDHPFKVFNNKTITTVLGTSFTITESKTETSVKLHEGKVKMNVRGRSESWILSPGEAFVFKENTPEIEHFENHIDFEKESLKNIIDYLKKEYAFSITIAEELLNKKTTLRIQKQDDIEIPLQIIAEIHNLDYNIDRINQKATLKN